MDTYQEIKSRQQKEVNNFPLGAAFSKKQFSEMLVKLGAKDKIEILSVGGGVFIHVKNKERFINLFLRHAEEMDNKMKQDQNGDGFILQMFLYELRNHEYGYTMDETDTLQSLDISKKDLQENKALKNGLRLAKKAIAKEEEEQEIHFIPLEIAK